MAEEKKNESERSFTVRIEGCEGCCGPETAGPDGKPRVVKVTCCPTEEKKEQ